VTGGGVVALQIVLLLALVAALFAGITFGTVNLPFREVWGVVGFHLGWTDVAPTAVQDQIIWDYRASRVLLAAVVGGALSLAGACLQVLARNPLADPYVLGVSSGAAFGAVLAAVTGWSVLTGIGLSGAAFASALVTLALVFLLAQRRGQVGPTRLVLAGVAISYLCTAATSFLQLYTNPLELRGIMFWILGSFSNARWSDLGLPAAVIVLSTVWLLGRARTLDLMSAGDDSASAMGVEVNRFRIELLVVTSVLTATSVAVSGGIGFVGLMIPHAARFVVGPDHRRMLPVTVLGGAVFMVLVDLASRIVDRPNELPVGIFTAALGAPFFLVLLRRSGRGIS
jgi:iron complex transport system permease protein